MTASWITRAWRREGLSGKILWTSLAPLSGLFALAAAGRDLFYRRGWLPVRKLPRPVVSIGNLTVGGTGKTPACLWLAGALEQKGIKIGILSRGYGGTRRGPVVLAAKRQLSGSPPTEAELAAAGDEPCMMAFLHGYAVAVCAQREVAAEALLKERDVDLFILDDGFQHRRVQRDVDLLLLGEDSSGRLLPAGPFREPLRAIERADLLLVTGDGKSWAARRPSTAKACFKGSFAASGLIGLKGNLWTEFPLSRIYRNKVVVVAGIAHPERFYRILHEHECDIVDIIEFPDHHAYSLADWQRINRLSRDAEIVVTTEKDLIKLARFPFARDKLFALRVQLAVENGAALVAAVLERVQNNRSGARETAGGAVQ